MTNRAVRTPRAECCFSIISGVSKDGRWLLLLETGCLLDRDCRAKHPTARCPSVLWAAAPLLMAVLRSPQRGETVRPMRARPRAEREDRERS